MMKFEDLRKGDRFWWYDGLEYRKDNDKEAHCVERGSRYFGETIIIDEEDEVRYNIATDMGD